MTKFITYVHTRAPNEYRIQGRIEQVWFETSKCRKAIYMKMVKQTFDKQTFVGPTLTMGPRKG